MPDALDIEGQDTPPADAVQSVTEYINGFAIRHIKGPRPFLNWQAGVLVPEFRSYRDPGMMTPFTATVSLFWVLGYGATRDEAVQMANQNENGRTR